MIAWWFGALLADAFVGRLAISFRALASLTLALAVVPLWHGMSAVRDIAVALGFTGVIAGCFALQERGWRLAPLAALGPLGAMSYTLYVVHFPILVLGSGLLMRATGGPLPSHFGWVAAGIAISLVVAWALHLVVERPFVSRRAESR